MNYPVNHLLRIREDFYIYAILFLLKTCFQNLIPTSGKLTPDSLRPLQRLVFLQMGAYVSSCCGSCVLY